MALMALDHAVFFVAGVHPLEFWGRPLPQHESAAWFLTRLVTHLCAPGFFFLMGVSVTLLEASRRRSGWSGGRITRHLFARGVLLVLIQQFLVNPAWYLGTRGSTEILGPGGPPGGGGDPFLNLDVLFGLGVCLMALSLLLHFKDRVVLAVSLVCLVGSQLLLPSPEQVDVLFSPWIRMLLVPGQTGGILVSYPVLPWLAIGGLGLLAGRHFLFEGDEAVRRLLPLGLGALILFVLAQAGSAGGGHGSGSDSGWIAFLSITKYPPSFPFFSFTMGLNLILLWALARLPRGLGEHRILLTFGGTALFFYVIHLYLYALVGWASSSSAGLAWTYGIWLGGMLILFPVCAWYGRFKRGTTADSIWRFF